MTKLLIATHNQGKLKAISEMLNTSLQGVEWLSLKDAGISTDIDETALTLLGNATLKAEAYAKESGLLTLADDTGLWIDALDGEPGIYPARWGGAELTSQQRYELVLTKMQGVPRAKRTARFRCVIAFASPDGLLAHTEGVFEGMIAEQAAGGGGFGYDPVFFVPDMGMTWAEMPASTKYATSHRAIAVQKMAPILQQTIA